MDKATCPDCNGKPIAYDTTPSMTVPEAKCERCDGAGEVALDSLTDDEVVRFYNFLEVDDPRCDVTAGEMERRNIDH